MKKTCFLIISLLFAFQIIAPSRLYAQCPAPTALTVSGLTQNSVVIAWQTSNVAGYYNVQYQTPNNPNWVVLSNVTSPLTITGLNCGGVYIAQVQQVCPQTATTNPLLSEWSTVTFTTPGCTNQCTTPSGLTATNISQNGAVLNWAGTSSATTLYNIRYHSGSSTTWTTLNNVTMPYQLGNLPCGSGFEWQVQQICNTTPGTFSGVSPWSTGGIFSTLACSNPCVTPTGSATTNISHTSAVLNWNPNIIATPSIYNIRYHTANSTTWTVVNNVSVPYQLGNLSCGTGYIWQVQQVCSTANEPSPWSVGTTFSTSACPIVCEAPSGLTATSINQTNAVLNWNPNSTTTSLYNLQYHSATSTAWISVNNITMPYTLANLSCGTGYAWQVQRICSNNPSGTTPILSPWTTSTFSTPACTVVCEAPSGLTTTNITQTSAVLNWNPNSTTTSLYNLQYHSTTSAAWITVSNVTMPYQLGNLTCGTAYAWRVQRVCSNAAGTIPTISDWTTITFSTSACPIVCEAPSELTTTNITQTSAVLNWNPNSTTAGLYNLQYHNATSTAWISVNNVTMPYQLGNLTCGTGYAWRVQRICTNNPSATTPTLSPWTTSTFSTPACPNPCVAPIGLTATNISQTGVVLNLTPTASTNSVYNIRYHSNSTTWITLNNVTLPYQLGNLPCGTTFEWQVQQVCGPATGTLSQLSPWSVGAAFSTLACPNPCAAPTQLTVAVSSQNTAVLTWAIPNTLAHYNVQYHADGNPNWITLNNVSSPLTITGLNCGGVYIFQVQQVCSNPAGVAIVSPWSTVTFTTPPCQSPCVAPIELHSTNISQNGAVLHWGLATTTGIYNIRYHSANSTAWITLTNVSMPYQLGNLPCGTGFEWQVQQVCLTTSPPTNTSLSPWSASSTFSTLACPNPCVAPIGLTATNISQTGVVLNLTPTASTNNVYNIRYHSNNSATWITLSNVTLPYQLGNLPCGTTFEWQVQQVCGPATGTLSQLSPWSVGAAFSTLACPNPCAAPTQLTVAVSSQNTAVITWATPNTTTHYNVKYRADGNPNWITLNNVSSPLTITGLNCGGVYICQVQQVCSTSAGVATVSPWSTVTFTIPPCQSPCVAPIELHSTNISQNGAVLHWESATTTGIYNIRYHSANSTAWITLTNVSMPYQLGNLHCGTGYVWQVQQICNTTPGTIFGLSPWSVGATFSTLICPNPNPCAAPTELTAANLTQTSAALHWVVVPGAVAYIVSYKPLNNTSAFITVTTNTNTITITGLTPSTSYTYQVRAICASGTTASSLSPLSASYIFATPAALVVYPNPANEILRISYLINQGSTVTIQLRDSFGQVVRSANEIATEGLNEFKIDTIGISEGIYFLTVITNSDTNTSKVFIKH